LNARLREYADYDEVKRELEIMKASHPLGLKIAVQSHFTFSTLNLVVQTKTKLEKTR
jgi:hypothetical protein